MTWKSIANKSIYDRLKNIKSTELCDLCNEPLSMTNIERYTQEEYGKSKIFIGYASCLNDRCYNNRLHAREKIFDFDKKQWVDMDRTWWRVHELLKQLKDT